jgi:hypothetical protein
MAKEKLFTPEDFDKPSPKCNRRMKKTLAGIVGIIIVGLIAWGIKLLSVSSTTPESPQPTPPAYTASAVNQESAGDTITLKEVVNEAQPTVEKQDDITVEKTANSTEPNISTTQISTNTSVSDDIEKEAQKVIRGDYGNVPQRQQLLGSRYQQIQSRVNQLKSEGVF